MKKIIRLIYIIFIVLNISTIAYSASADFPAVYNFNWVESFRAVGVVMDTPDFPLHRLQKMMDFQFEDEKVITRQYITEEPEDTDNFPGTYTLELNLTYSKTLLRNLDIDFILGNFVYTLEHNGTLRVYEGLARGRLSQLSTSGYDIPGISPDTYVIILDCQAQSDAFGQRFILSTPNTQLVTVASPQENLDKAEVNNDNFNEDFNDNFNGDFFHESQPHLPAPYEQMDVAAGVGVATVGIVVLNALTNTSVFGSASFNGSFNPQASPLMPPGAGLLNSMASTATHGVSATVASQTASTASGGGGILNTIGDFFKKLLHVLRDMLTDEGRSYASGHLTDALSEVDISDLTDK